MIARFKCENEDRENRFWIEENEGNCRMGKNIVMCEREEAKKSKKEEANLIKWLSKIETLKKEKEAKESEN